MLVTDGESLPMEATRLIVVSGHKSTIRRGPAVVDGSVTITKKATAWEVLMYTGMALQLDEALSTLALFAPPVVAILPPEDDGVSDWVYVERMEDRPLLIAHYQQLQKRSADTHGYSEVMDTPIWGVCLIDVTATLRRPCVADIKIGFLRHSPHTPAEKLQRITAKRLLQPHALRLCGAHHCFHRTVLGDQRLVEESCGKDMGYAMQTEESYRRFLRAFFSSTLSTKEEGSDAKCTDGDRVSVRSRICRKQVEELFAFFTSSPGRSLLQRFAFVSTSLLFVYDSASLLEDGVDCGTTDGAHVYLIDYSRSSHRRLNFAEEKVGFLQGLQNMVHLLS